MKSVITVCMVIFLSYTAQAQTWDEWFKQKKTQIRYLEDQVAALQMYESYAKKGYEIAKNGLGSISSLAGGEYNLHQLFFSSLSKASSSIQHDYRTVKVVSMQQDIEQEKMACLRLICSDQYISKSERTYVNAVFQNLLDSCANDMADLTATLSNGQLQLTDDERLKRIATIYSSMNDKYVFAHHFKNSLRQLLLSRQKEENEAEELKTFYNLK